MRQVAVVLFNDLGKLQTIEKPPGVLTNFRTSLAGGSFAPRGARQWCQRSVSGFSDRPFPDRSPLLWTYDACAAHRDVENVIASPSDKRWMDAAIAAARTAV